MKRVLFVCLSDPSSGAKGDAKLISERRKTLEQMSFCIDLVYFKIKGWWGVSVDVEKVDERAGVDVIVTLGILDVLKGFVRSIEMVRKEPVQTWLSYAIYGASKKTVSYIVSTYACVHFYHIRSVGLWRCLENGKRCVIDLIDSYTLNLKNRAALEKSLARLVLINEELRRIRKVERSLDSYIKDMAATIVTAVTEEDLSYFGDSGIRKAIVPVGIEVNGEFDSMPRSYEELECIFFGNLDYEPNINACKVLIKVMKRLRDISLREKVSITVAGRNIRRGLKRELVEEGISVISPVVDMEDLVHRHNVAILPMFSGSGMQSKTLESIAWGCLVVATERAVKPLGLKRDLDYIEVGSVEEICQALGEIVTGGWDTTLLRENAFKEIQEFKWSETCKRLAGLYV